MNIKRLLLLLIGALLCTINCYSSEVYNLSIEQMFALAEENSKTLKIENSTIKEAQQAIEVTRNRYIPEIEVSLSASYLGNGYILDRDFSNGNSVKMPHFGNNFAIKASQLIYDGGATINSTAMAKLKAAMAKENRNATRANIRFMLIGFYLDLAKLKNLLAIYDHNIELTKTIIKDTQVRHKTGVTLKNDITRYELQLKDLELARKRVENSVEILNYDLTTTLGLPSDISIQPDTTLLYQSLPKKGMSYWQNLAHDNAYSIKQSDISIKMGECNEKLVQAERYPIVSLFAANHFDGPITIEIPTINKNFNYWHIGIGVSFKLSSLYKSNNNITLAKFNTETSRFRNENIIEQTQLTIQADYIKYLETFDEVSTLEKSLQLANENYTTIKKRYHNGIALITDMLDASNQLLEAEIKLANAKINVIFNYYKLKHSAGII